MRGLALAALVSFSLATSYAGQNICQVTVKNPYKHSVLVETATGSHTLRSHKAVLVSVGQSCRVIENTIPAASIHYKGGNTLEVMLQTPVADSECKNPPPGCCILSFSGCCVLNKCAK